MVSINTEAENICVKKKVFILQEKILNATLSLNMGQIFTVWCIARYVLFSKNG